jgi:hypothetical protein
MLRRRGRYAMNTNVNLTAPLGALALLGTVFMFVVALTLLIHSLVVRKMRRSQVVFALMAMLAVAYFGTLVIFSFASHEKALAPGEEKYFCELDCHLAYSIAGSRQAKQFGDQTHPLAAHGEFTIISIKTRFDETTISPQRGNGLLYPNPRLLILLDQNGNRYKPSAQTGIPLTSPLRPGEFYMSDIAFDLPAAARPATLLFGESDWLTHLIIGHENSPFHKKVTFKV